MIRGHRLCSIHGQIGIFEKLIGIRAIRRGNSEADARTNVHLLPVDIIRRAQAFDNPNRKRAAFFRAGQVSLNNCELVTAKAGDKVAVLAAIRKLEATSFKSLSPTEWPIGH